MARPDTSGPREAPRRVPAALALGVLSGVLAAVAVLPTIVPLTHRVGTAEDVSAMARALGASRAIAVMVEHDLDLRSGIARRLTVDGIMVLDRTGAATFASGDAPDVPAHVLCPSGESPGRFLTVSDTRWATACQVAGTGSAVVAVKPTTESTRTLSFLVLGLAGMVGISTSFGVLQILSPLSRIKAALERVGQGERGVRLQTTGMSELDDLIERLNAAARAVEDREDAITARIQVVQEMARVVAHEIRNPLQSLELLASLIAAEDEPEERTMLADSIRTEVRVLEKVVSRMLKSGDKQPLRLLRRPTSVTELLRKVVAFRAPEARHRGIRLEIGTTVDHVLEIDRTLLSRAIENLVGNSLEFAPVDRGRVVLSAREEGGFIVILVEDDGPGVPTDLGDTIYQPDVTARPGGTGLGLALVQGVLHAHGGYVEHDRSPLGGARFRAWIPIEIPEDEEQAGAHPGGG